MTPRPDLAGVSVVTFDAAGTLLHPHPSVGEVYREIGLRHGRDHPAALLEAGFHAALAGVSRQGIRAGAEAQELDFWRRVVAQTVAAAGGPPADFEAYFAELWEAFARGARWRCFRGVEETLHTLKRRGYRLGVLSNWDRRLHPVLAETGLRPLFDAVVISSEAGAEKPDAAIFRAAEAAFRETPEHMLHVGDSVEHDLRGAEAAGWHALLVSGGRAPARPEEIGELAKLLEMLPGTDTSRAQEPPFRAWPRNGGPPKIAR